MKVPTREHPSIRALSSSSRGMSSKKPTMIQITSGRTTMMWASDDPAERVDQPELAVDDEQRHQERDAGQDADHEQQEPERRLATPRHAVGGGQPADEARADGRDGDDRAVHHVGEERVLGEDVDVVPERRREEPDGG